MKTYELGERIAFTQKSEFYKIKGKKKLGAKIPNLSRYILATQDVYDQIRINYVNEYSVGKKLNKLRISTPKYVGISQFTGGDLLGEICLGLLLKL